MSDALRLNLGAGDVPLPGYVNIDRKAGQEAVPLAYPDESVAEVRASHLLEHFSYYEVPAVLREWARVLRPGGVLKIAVPDFDKLAEWHRTRPDLDVQPYLMGGQIDANDYHKSIFNRECLTGLLTNAGLTDLREWSSDAQDCAATEVSLNLQGTKPEGPQPARVDVIQMGWDMAAVMTLPRLGFTDCHSCIERFTAETGILVRKGQGVFWGQCLTRTLERALGYKYILTLDYDTVFTTEDVGALYHRMETYPEMDAVFALQMGRGGYPLFRAVAETKQADGRVVFAPSVLREDLTPCRSGHFGLTLLRTESLKRLPKPWFLPHPDPEGGWGDRRMDEDLHFWQQWGAAGLTAYQANRVVIGHLELVCTWPSAELRPHYQPLREFGAHGKPSGVSR